MVEVSIPGHKVLRLSHLVLDYNGTLAVDGEVVDGVREALDALAGQVRIHVVTADTFGKAASRLEGFPCELVVLSTEDQALAKREYVERLGAGGVAAVGNGRNDRLMLADAALGVAVVQGEGAAVETLLAADLVCPNIVPALELLANPLRLVATLRS